MSLSGERAPTLFGVFCCFALSTLDRLHRPIRPTGRSLLLRGERVADCNSSSVCMATVAAVWAPFASGSKVPASAKTPAVLKAVWQGVPEKHPIRANVWRLAREQDALPPVRGLPKASRQVEEKVGMELNSEGCFAFVGGADAPAVEKLLMAHAQRGALDDYMPGSVQLAALLLQEFHNDSAEALSTLLALTAKISTYFAHSHVHLRRDCLVLADLIVSHLKPLADHLNSVQFDV